MPLTDLNLNGTGITEEGLEILKEGKQDLKVSL